MRKKRSPSPLIECLSRTLLTPAGQAIVGRSPTPTMRELVEDLACVAADLIRWPDQVPVGSEVLLSLRHCAAGSSPRIRVDLFWKFREGTRRGDYEFLPLDHAEGRNQEEALINLASKLFLFIDGVHIAARLYPLAHEEEELSVLMELVHHARDLNWQMHRHGWYLAGSIGRVRDRFLGEKMLKDRLKRVAERQKKTRKRR